MTHALDVAAQQEAEMLKHLGVDESKGAGIPKPVGAAATQAGRHKYIRGHEILRTQLKQGGMDEWEIDCHIATEILGEEPPPEPAARVAAREAEDKRLAAEKLAKQAGLPVPAPSVAVDPPGTQVEVRPGLPPAEQPTGFTLPYVEPREMSDEEMAAATRRVRAARAAVSDAEELLAEVEQSLADARAELAEAQREVAAGAAWLTG